MLSIEFPSSDPYYQFTTPLNGVTYILLMHWMSRSGWHMSVYDSKYNLIAANTKLVPNFPLFYQKVSINFDGDFIIAPLNTDTEITEDNLASSWNIIYLSEEDIAGG